MRPARARLLAVLAGSAIAGLAAGAPARADDTLTGRIESFECGDNCYLTIADPRGEKLTGLCAAPECAPWNEKAAMPRAMKGKSVRVTLGTGQQTDADGAVMGEAMAFDRIEFLP